MATRTSSKANFDGAELRAAADKFASSNKVWAAIQQATSSPESLIAAQKNPEAFFASFGARLPKGLALDIFSHPPRQLPSPDWFPFVIEFQNCRSYWVRECDKGNPPLCTFKEETVCFGFRLWPRLPMPRR